jgi:hypothetical protein
MPHGSGNTGSCVRLVRQCAVVVRDAPQACLNAAIPSEPIGWARCHPGLLSTYESVLRPGESCKTPATDAAAMHAGIAIALEAFEDIEALRVSGFGGRFSRLV